MPLTDTDRRTLVRYGLPIEDRLSDVIFIVRPETVLPWNRRMKRQKWTFDNASKRPGRPPKAKATEALALRMAEENASGYIRITGELKKLGHEVSLSYVRDLMKKRFFAGEYQGQPTLRHDARQPPAFSLSLGRNGPVRSARQKHARYDF